MPGESFLYLLTVAIMTVLAFKHAPITLMMLWAAGIVLFLATRGEISNAFLDLKPASLYAVSALFVGGVVADAVKPWRLPRVRNSFTKFFKKPSP